MFEYEEMKTAGVSDYTNKTPHKHFEWIKSPCPTAVINKKISNKCAYHLLEINQEWISINLVQITRSILTI